MKVNKIVCSLLAICLTLTALVATAQDGRPRRSPEERAQKQTQWMQQNLRLTEDQNRKVYDIILYYARENDKTNAEAPGREKKMDKRGIRNDREAELRGVLNPEQFAKYQQHMQEMKARQQERRGMMGGN